MCLWVTIQVRIWWAYIHALCSFVCQSELVGRAGRLASSSTCTCPCFIWAILYTCPIHSLSKIWRAGRALAHTGLWEWISISAYFAIYNTMSIGSLSISECSIRTSVHTSVGIIIAKCAKGTKIVRTSIHAHTGLIVSIGMSSSHIDIWCGYDNRRCQRRTSINTKTSAVITKIILCLWAEWNAHVSAIVCIPPLLTSEWSYLAMWSIIGSMVEVAPRSILTHFHTDMLVYLSEPHNASMGGTIRHTWSISSLVSILISGTLWHASIGWISAKHPWRLWANDHTLRWFCGVVPIKSSIKHSPIWLCVLVSWDRGCFWEVEALRYACTSYVISPLYVCIIEETYTLARPSIIVCKQFIRSLWAPQSYHTSILRDRWAWPIN